MLNFHTLHPGSPFFQTHATILRGVACTRVKICTSIHRHRLMTPAVDQVMKTESPWVGDILNDTTISSSLTGTQACRAGPGCSTPAPSPSPAAPPAAKHQYLFVVFNPVWVMQSKNIKIFHIFCSNSQETCPLWSQWQIYMRFFLYLNIYIPFLAKTSTFLWGLDCITPSSINFAG